MQPRRGGERIVESLTAAGVDTIFGIPGDHTLEFWRGLSANESIRAVVPRHEQGAAFMADGYARISGRYGVCLLITGPGLTNALTPLAQAYSDSSPVLAITSQNPAGVAESGLGYLHEIRDQRAVAAGALAWSRRVRTAPEWTDAFGAALAQFQSMRPRPVHIEVPYDDLAEIWPRTEPPASPPPLPAPDPELIRRAADLVRAAERPLLILGGGAAGAARPALELAERLGAHVLHSPAGKGTVPEDHPLCLGGAFHEATVHQLVERADLVIAVGTQLAPSDMWAGPLPLPANQIRIDLDPLHLESATVGLQADAGPALRALEEALGELPQARRRRYAAEAVVAGFRAEVASRPRGHSVQILQAIRRALPHRGAVFADMTTIAYAGYLHFPVYEPRSWIYPAGYGTLGFSLPAAIGAKLAAPQRPIISLIGDGGFLFTCQELLTAAELKLSLPIVVYNNRGYRQIRKGMEKQGIPPIGVDLLTPDIPALARAMRVEAAHTDDPAQLPALLERALETPRPTVIEVQVPPA